MILLRTHRGVVEEVEQDHAAATFAPKVNRELARVDWNYSAQELDWHLRGMDSVPGAWSTLEGMAVKLFGPTPETRFSHGATPGAILDVSADSGLLVACGRGALRVAEVQPAGSRRMPVAAWLRGHPIPSDAGFV